MKNFKIDYFQLISIKKEKNSSKEKKERQKVNKNVKGRLHHQKQKYFYFFLAETVVPYQAIIFYCIFQNEI